MRTRTILLSSLLLLLFQPIPSQVVSGDLGKYLENLVEEIPGSNGNHYAEPSRDDLDQWGTGLLAFLEGDLETARQVMELLHYRIVEFHDTLPDPENICYIFQENYPQNNYWGSYAFYANPFRGDLVLQAPHSLYDMNTGLQAIHCFRGSSAGALFLSGTHRCNLSLPSPCDGITTVCSGTSEPYRISDMAHNVQSVFQKSTEVFSIHRSSSVFVQLHGFAKGATDPYVIMSNGTRITPEVDILSMIREKLTVADPVLTFRVAHIDLSWTRLIAFTNTQGRYINGSPDPCHQDATDSGGRFVHIEQERTRLRESEGGWDKMLFALSSAFAPDTSNTFSAPDPPAISFSVYPNPTPGPLHISCGQPVELSLYGTGGALLKRYQRVMPGTTIRLDNLPAGIYCLRVSTPSGILFHKIVKMNY